ncbi:MAG TPA: CBS domain-containing protein [Sandaracinaceae bacterium LLY-WYZ-13_1]|nr:CBS domain-containing protein [Sandaracinaceae bacterium LLY-WYZ-13_1]
MPTISPPNEPSQGGWLRARRARTEDGIDLTVDCPKTGGAVSVGTCDRCRAALTLAADDTGMSVYVRCAEADSKVRPRSLAPAPPPAVPDPAPTRNDDPTFVPVTRIMRRAVAVADADLPATELTASLLEEGIGGAPVVDEDGRLLGIVSRTDLLRAFGEGGAVEALRASDLMSPAVYVMRLDSTVAEAAALMAYEGVHRVPVLDEEDQLVGLVSSLDVTRWVAQVAGFHAPAFGSARS